MSAGQLSPYSLRRVAPSVETGSGDPGLHGLLEPPSEGAGIDLRQIWKTLRKRIGIVIAIPIVVCVISAIREMMLPELFTASSTILIRSSTPLLLGDSAAAVQSSVNSDNGGDTDMFLNTKYELLHTSSLALKVIRAEDLSSNSTFTGIGGGHRFFLTKLLADIKHRIKGTTGNQTHRPTLDPEGLVGAYLGALQVQPIVGTQLVRLTFTTVDPQLSAQLANAHVRQFIERSPAVLEDFDGGHEAPKKTENHSA